MGDMDINGDLVGFVPINPAAVGDDPPGAGETCELCKRRVPHPKKESSPVSKTRAYRVPLDEADAHEDVLTEAAKFLGTHERPHWQYQTMTIALALVLQDESLKGMAHRG